MDLMETQNCSLCPSNSCIPLNLSYEAPEASIFVNWTEIYNSSCDCSSWHKDTQHATAIAAIRIVTSVFSIIGSASIILSVLLTGKLSAAEVHPLFILSVADFILSILWMIGGVVWINPGEEGWGSSPHTGMCYVLGIATTMMEMVTFMLTSVYALNALLRIKEVYQNKGLVLPSNDSRKKLRHFLTVLVYIASWVLPLVIVLPVTESIVGINTTNNGCWCVLDFYNLRPDDGIYGSSTPFNMLAVIHATILGVTFIILSLLMIVMYGVTFFYAKGVVKQSQYVERDRGEKLIRSIVKRLSLYLLIFFISGIPALLASFVVWGEKERLQPNEPVDLIVLIVHAIFIPLQGFLNAIVYGWSRKEFRKAMNVKERIQYRNRNRDYESLNQGTSSYRGKLGASRAIGTTSKT